MVVGIGFMAWDMTPFPLVEGSMKRGELENIKASMDLEDLVPMEDKSQWKRPFISIFLLMDWKIFKEVDQVYEL